MALLRQGSRGDEVRRLQEALAAAGFSPGAIDGVYGPRTAAAVEAWKRSKGYGVTDGSQILTEEIGLGGGAAPGGAPTGGGDAIGDYARANYGYLGAFIDHPEVGPIIRRAAQEGWDAPKLQGALYATNWWKTTGQTLRSWEALRSSDPAEAARQIDRKAASLGDLASSLGVPLSGDRLRQISEDSIKYGWTDADVRNVLGAEFNYISGSTQALPAQLRDAASAYGLRIGDDNLNHWSRMVIMGNETMETYNVYLRNQAKALFPAWADAIERGSEVRVLAAPYLNLAAQELERSPEEIWMNDRYMGSVFHGASVGTLPSMADFTKALRALPEWRTTTRANEMVSAWGARLLDWFGRAEMG